MTPDINTFLNFYQSSLGQHCCHHVRTKIHQIWPDFSQDRILGMGYPLPYLKRIYEKENEVFVAMSRQQGACSWSAEKNKVFARARNIVSLVAEDALPFLDHSFNRILLIHALEYSPQPQILLRECWRLLCPEGRLLVCVPQRHGVWGHLGQTPFSQGKTFSSFKLRRHFEEQFFLPLQSGSALFFPPKDSRRFLRFSTLFENVGSLWAPKLAGAILLEGQKKVSGTLPLPRVMKPAILKPL